MYSAIIDNTALVYVTQLHDKRSFFDQFKNIFHTLYIPMSVKTEYEKGLLLEPNRLWLLDRLKPEQGFFRLCTSYDSFTLLLVKDFEGMDQGESESYAQFKKIGAQLIISDDKAFIKALGKLDPGIKVYTTLHLICWLDVLNYLPANWNSIVTTIHAIRPFQSRDLRLAYKDILLKLGIEMPKKVLSKKCSLKTILP